METSIKKKTLKNATIFKDKVIHGIKHKMRVDIGDYCKNLYEANIIRVILFNKGKFHKKYLKNYDLLVIVDEDGVLFDKKRAFVFVDFNLSLDMFFTIKDSWGKENIYVIASQEFVNDSCKYMARYEDFEQAFDKKIPLWETQAKNVMTHPDIYNKEWVIGKKELKRKHKKFFHPQGKSVKVGQLWIKQPFVGRPKYDNMFMDTFKIIDDKSTIFEHDNWGSIIQMVRQHMRDNPNDYYNNNRYAMCMGHVKKTDTWVDIVKYNTMSNEFVNKEHFL